MNLKNNHKRNNNKKKNNEIELFNSKIAHQEMIVRSGSGIIKLINTINECNDNIEKKNVEIELLCINNIILKREINNLEKKIIELKKTYKFEKYGIIIQFNKYRIIRNIKNLYLYKFLIYRLKYYILFIIISILLINSYRFNLFDLNYLKSFFQ